MGVGISKYIVGNNLKLQASLFKTNYTNPIGIQDNEFMSAAFLVQIIF